MTQTTAHPDVALPPGTHILADNHEQAWSDYDKLYRLVWGEARSAESSNFNTQPVAAPLPDGSVPIEGVDGTTPEVYVDEIRDGVSYEQFSLTVEGARGLAAALIAAADEVKGWASR
jgi:hypothetical protein